MNKLHPYQELILTESNSQPMNQDDFEYWTASYGFTRQFIHAKQQVVDTISWHRQLLKKDYPRKDQEDTLRLKGIETHYLDLGDIAGAVIASKWILLVNPFYLLWNGELYLDEIIPHELAHFLAFNNDKYEGHGKIWKGYCIALGCKKAPDSTHQYPKKAVVQNYLEKQFVMDEKEFII